MMMKAFALGAVVAAAAFAAPAQAQIWKRGDVILRSDERVIGRSDTRVIDGARCVDVRLERYGSRRTEQMCDWDRDGVYGDSDDRRHEERRRDSRYGYGVHRNRGQARAAEVHARNEARKREKEYEKEQRERLKERQEREREILKERQKRNGRWP